ncbi:MAG: Asp-tRNA(Asn)/Glu-tRNA(Gln) amidotransferase subunit GatC [bacterium]
MKLSDSDLLKLADLSKLNLTPKELSKFHEQLTSVFEMFEKLKNVNTEGVEFLSFPERNRMREDKEVSSTGNFLKNAKKVKNGYLKVKSVLGKAT